MTYFSARVYPDTDSSNQPVDLAFSRSLPLLLVAPNVFTFLAEALKSLLPQHCLMASSTQCRRLFCSDWGWLLWSSSPSHVYKFAVVSPFDRVKSDPVNLPCVPAVITVLAVPSPDRVELAVDGIAGKNHATLPTTAVSTAAPH